MPAMQAMQSSHATKYIYHGEILSTKGIAVSIQKMFMVE